MLKRYFERHFHFNDIFRPHKDQEMAAVPPAKQFGRGFGVFLTLLRFLPILCGLAFGASFFWDFGPENSLWVFGYEIGLEGLMRTISVSGLIGFGTNWLAIKMLFRPLDRRPIWGQGLIPAQKDRIVYQLARGIHKHILSEELIRKRIQESGIISRVNTILINGTENVLHDEEFKTSVKEVVYNHLKKNMAQPEVREKITSAIEGKLEENLKSGFKGLVFRTYKRFRPSEYEGMMNDLLDNVPATVVEILEELEKETPKLTGFLKEKQGDFEKFYFKLVVEVLERIDIPRLLSKQMAHLDERGLEAMIRNATDQQLLYIQYLGTLLGILGGFLIWKPEPVLAFYLSLLGLLYVADVLIYRYRQRSA